MAKITPSLSHKRGGASKMKSVYDHDHLPFPSPEEGFHLVWEREGVIMATNVLPLLMKYNERKGKWS